MKTLTTQKLIIGFVLNILLFVSVSAQNALIEKPFYHNSISSLVMGIGSDNPGVKKACVYFAGKYDLHEAVNVLIDQLVKEKNGSIKKLIAVALLEIDDKAGAKALKNSLMLEKDMELKRYLYAVVNSIEST